MTNEEKLALKVACIRAAATLTADPNRVHDVGYFAAFVKGLYGCILKIEWEKESP